jgi:ribulose-phosphate 3-epimerase
MRQIIPALIISDDNPANYFNELKEKFKKLRPFLAELGDWVQIDVTDGKFVSTETRINIEDFIYFTERTNVEFHLMIEKPEESIGEWARTAPKRIIVHIEAVSDMKGIIDVCREHGIEIGLAINPETPNTLIELWTESIDLVLFMGVHPGKGGQEFISDVLPKIKSLRQNFPNVKIEIDGGVRLENIDELKDAGVDYFIVGSGILKSSDIKKSIEEFINKIK